MSNPIEFEFITKDGRKLTGKADGYASAESDTGLSARYEECWAEDEEGEAVALSDEDDDRLYDKAAVIANEPDEDDYL